MMKKILFATLVASILLFVSCEENEETKTPVVTPCDTAILCMVNNTSDTISYCWGCNMYSERVAPGGKACKKLVGPIDENQYSWVYFQTNQGTRVVKVDRCYVEADIR